MTTREEVLAFWVPEGMGDTVEIHKEHMLWRFRGGADDAIVERFTAATEAAARGELDDWAETARGRLALIIVLDQFSRSVYRDSPRAYAQDARALQLTLEGLDRGHYDALDHVWEKVFFALPLTHAEGPDHLERVERSIVLGDQLIEEAPPHLRQMYTWSAQQPREVHKVIARFGRHPHRNEVLGRASTDEEKLYIAQGEFPHLRKPDV